MSSTPFESSAPIAWLALLLVIWAGLLFGGYASSLRGGAQAHRMLTWTRLGSSLVLVVAGWSWLAAAWAMPARGFACNFALLIAVGMTLGFLGDLFMAGVIGGTPNTLGGMVAFGAGHLAYITAIVSYATKLASSPGARLAAWAAWLAVGIVGWYFAVWRGARAIPDGAIPDGATPMRWAALPYALLLSSTAGAATGLALQAAIFVPLAVGAALFLFSDLLIAADIFSQRRLKGQNNLIWLTYGPGQMLIVYSIGAALATAITP